MATKTAPKATTKAAKETKAPAAKPAAAKPAAGSAKQQKPAAPSAPAKAAAVKPAVAKPAAKSAPKPAVKAAPTAKPAAKAAPAKTPATGKTPAPAAPPTPKPKQAPAPQQKWREIRELLLQMKSATLQEIAKSIKKGSETSVGEEPTGDIYDQASSERDRELGLILNDREREKLHNIDDALLRMDEGDYGICEECDEEIPLGRLKAMPFTRHCVKCKSDLEKLQAQTRRFEEDRSYREMPVGDDDEI